MAPPMLSALLSGSPLFYFRAGISSCVITFVLNTTYVLFRPSSDDYNIKIDLSDTTWQADCVSASAWMQNCFRNMWESKMKGRQKRGKDSKINRGHDGAACDKWATSIREDIKRILTAARVKSMEKGLTTSCRAPLLIYILLNIKSVTDVLICWPSPFFWHLYIFRNGQVDVTT